MALRIRYASTPGATLGYSIERLADGLYYDFNNAVFTATPTTLMNSLTAATGLLGGLYRDTIASTPQSVFSNGEYAVNIHNIGATSAVIGVLGATMFGGDSAPVFAAPAVDPWTALLPGSYLSGTAGAILGTYLDAKISTRSTGAGQGADPWATTLPGSYAQGTAGSILGSYLDAKVSTRSTYAGGPVASVMTPVTVGTVNDKAGYSLAASGLDNIVVETGINVRQALSPILAAAAGSVSGAGTGTIIIRGGNVATTRITASTDNAGNRSSVTLSLPT